MKIVPTGLFVLAKPYKKTSRIIRPASAEDEGEFTPLRALAVGPGQMDQGEWIKPPCEPGDWLLATQSTATMMDDEVLGRVLIIHAGSIVAILEDFNEATWEPIGAKSVPLN